MNFEGLGATVAVHINVVHEGSLDFLKVEESQTIVDFAARSTEWIKLIPGHCQVIASSNELSLFVGLWVLRGSRGGLRGSRRGLWSGGRGLWSGGRSLRGGGRGCWGLWSSRWSCRDVLGSGQANQNSYSESDESFHSLVLIIIYKNRQRL
jgi:hypothetical protein